MRHVLTARPLAAMVAACLMVSPIASAQQSQAAPESNAQSDTPTVASANIIAAPPEPATKHIIPTPPVSDAVKPASTPEALSSELVGKMFFLRGFYQDDKLEFSTEGKVVGSPQKGSFALSMVQIDKVKFSKHNMELQAHRVGLHFFGALPYEDDSTPFEKIKVDPKKSMTIQVERLVIEPEKKKKKKDEKGKDAPKIAAAPVAGAPPTAASADAAAATTTASLPDAPAPASTTIPASPATTASAVKPVITDPAASHDPRVSFLELSKALNMMFAPGLDDSIIATLPPYWQNYFATKAGKARADQDASMMRPGGNVRAPQLLSPIDPDSNDYAQKNNIAGMVFLQMVVDAQGRPGAVTIVRPIGFGLDERAVDAIQHARFRPGTVNGSPVPELVNLQVTFRIYSNRTRPNGKKGTPPTQIAPKESPKGPPSNAPVLAAATVNE